MAADMQSGAATVDTMSLQSFAAASERVADRGQQRSVHASMRRFSKWMTEQSALGPLHRSLRQEAMVKHEIEVGDDI
eukprot:1979940-Pyramimonas_sp.AAC.1